MAETPGTLYIAASSDPESAKEEWDGMEELARDDVIAVDVAGNLGLGHTLIAGRLSSQDPARLAARAERPR